MPVKVPDGLPAQEVLSAENIFVISEEKAIHQDIRELKLVICNLMPLKIEAENQLLRVLSNSPLQVDITLLFFGSHSSRHTSKKHLEMFYKSFAEVSRHHCDGLIISGAPLGGIPFNDVYYWEEMKVLNDWARENVTSTMYLCWAAQAGLHLNCGIDRQRLPKKLFGVFPHTVRDCHLPIVRGFDDVFMAPHSRENTHQTATLDAHPDLEIAAESEAGGAYIILGQGGKQVYLTGHSEYDSYCLRNEYLRDREKGIDIQLPVNYFPNDDPQAEPLVQWRGHANLLYTNWLNYYVYQRTPYDWNQK